MAHLSKKVLLDTTVLIDVLHRRPEMLATLKTLVRDDFELATSAINVAEIYAGVRPGEESSTDALVGSLACFDLNRELAQQAGALVTARRQVGRTDSLDDMIIAATAIRHDCLLFTGNRKDFEVPGIHFYPPEVE
jgi:predicted nucleic acid-binding protein